MHSHIHLSSNLPGALGEYGPSQAEGTLHRPLHGAGTPILSLPPSLPFLPQPNPPHRVRLVEPVILTPISPTFHTKKNLTSHPPTPPSLPPSLPVRPSPASSPSKTLVPPALPSTSSSPSASVGSRMGCVPTSSTIRSASSKKHRCVLFLPPSLLPSLPAYMCACVSCPPSPPFHPPFLPPSYPSLHSHTLTGGGSEASS
jgi:hypothetical protein